MYTGDERDTPSERVQSEFESEEDYNDDQSSAVGVGRSYDGSSENSRDSRQVPSILDDADLSVVAALEPVSEDTSEDEAVIADGGREYR